MKLKELRALSQEELKLQLDETQQELFNLRFQSASGKSNSSMKVRVLKRDLARMHTILRERKNEKS